MNDFATNAGVGRFSSLLSRHVCPKPLYDEVLARLHNCVVTPTLGSIIPNWLLIIPEEPILNFSEWKTRFGISPERLVLDNRPIEGAAQGRAVPTTKLRHAMSAKPRWCSDSNNCFRHSGARA